MNRIHNALSQSTNNNYYFSKKQKGLLEKKSNMLLSVPNSLNGLNALASINISFLKKNNNISFGVKDSSCVSGENIENLKEKLISLVKQDEQIDSSFVKYFLNYLDKVTLSVQDLNSCDVVLRKMLVVLNKPDKYINGNVEAYTPTIINNFFRNNLQALVKFNSVYDKSTLDVLLRRRFDKAADYLNIFSNLNNENLKLLAQMNKACNVDGKPFLEKQKIEFIDLIKIYEDLGLSTQIIKKMIEEDRIDLGKLQIDLTKGVMKKLGFSDNEISKISFDKLVSFDKNYVHLLAKTAEFVAKKNKVLKDTTLKDTTLKDYCYGMLFENNFIDYIHDESNKYGEINNKTKEEFKAVGIDYSKWIKPSTASLRFLDNSLSSIATNVENTMQAFYDDDLNKFIEARFKDCVKGGLFKLTPEAQQDKKTLKKFILETINKLSTVKKFATQNMQSDSVENKERAKNRLDLLKKLDECLENLKRLNSKRDIDWSIKIWDRIKPNNIFQGNYSTCCIGMGGSHCDAMSHYIMNTSFNMIELVDNKTNDIVGNALCYFMIDNVGSLAFIIDNVEISEAWNLSDDLKVRLRNSILEYASNLVKDTTQQDNLPIYISTFLNDINLNGELALYTKKLAMVGEMLDYNVYLDLFGKKTGKEKRKNWQTTVKVCDLRELQTYEKTSST